ncbi:hypothetical protein ZOSMA_30G00990 [Zostera marina]|uniref:ATP-dependent DNA helicase n=1 Tax=Zostera marina TaxID=29655 RepID=A0A0K9PA22_ZOSMR|nr:hypothetical protein ZOSMA_30G00990 [Zostera marina]
MASTGVAAFALGGQTLYSFADVGLGKGRKNELLSFILKSNKAVDRLKRAKALAIDEINMIDGELFDNLKFLASSIHNSEPTPWGGIQLIVSGDFFQLSPINAPNPRNEFAFESACWEKTFDVQMELTHVYRQSDSELIDFLEGIRRGQVDRDNKKFQRFLLGTTSDNLSRDQNDIETRLFPRTDDVRRVNHERLKYLGKEVVRFNVVDKGSLPWLNQLKYLIAPDELKICEGARVMLIKTPIKQLGS